MKVLRFLILFRRVRCRLRLPLELGGFEWNFFRLVQDALAVHMSVGLSGLLSPLLVGRTLVAMQARSSIGTTAVHGGGIHCLVLGWFM